MTPSHVLKELQSQHDKLRVMMDRCEELADSIDAADGDPMPLAREVTKLRLAFEAHNVFEEQLLRPLLLANDAFAATRIDRMIEDHVAEHTEMRARLSAAPLPATADLRDLIETLRAHLDAEDRYLLTAKVLRDDLVTVESSS